VQQVGTGKPCEGEAEETTFCNTDPCKVPCLWADWGEWSNCTKTCGGGMHVRARVKLQEAQYGGQNCTGEPSEQTSCASDPCAVDCSWGDWGAWGPCSTPCGNGTKLRTRSQKSEESGGKACIGPESEMEECGQPC